MSVDKVSYFGLREHGAARVVRFRPGRDAPEGAELDLRLDLRAHSPTGFDWGYAGSGPSQLALALLADYLGDDAGALRLYQPFKSAVVAGLPRAGWTLSQQAIADALARLGQESLEIDSVEETGDSWRPLEAALGRRGCEEFMWMGSSGAVQLYKHILTRRYLRIDSRTGAFYDADHRPLNREAAVKVVLG